MDGITIPKTVPKKEMDGTAIQKTVARNKRAIRNRRIVLITVVVLLVFTCIVFAALVFINNHLLTVSIVKPGIGTKAIGLSEDGVFEDPLTMIGTGKSEQLDHYTYAWLPGDIEKGDGEKSKFEAYVAYTFYLKNLSDATIKYNMKIITKNVTKNLDEALRVMVILNGERDVYAKLNKETGEPEWITGPVDPDKEKYGYSKPFEGAGLVCDRTKEDFEAGGIDRYTIVFWLEGEDPECINTVLDGGLKMDIQFTVIENNV